MTQKRVLEPSDLYRLRLISDAQIAPDGSRVAFVLKQMDEDKNDYLSNVYVADREGSVTRFTSGDKDSAPRWSPDGKYLAFLSGRKDKAQIYLLSTAGGESQVVTDCKLGAGAPVWSPDSTAIAFAAAVSTDPEDEKEDKDKDKDDEKKVAPTKIVERTGYKADGVGFIGDRRRHLFLLDVASREVRQLTEGDFNDSGPAWSPDSRHLAFASKRTADWDLTLGTDIYVIPREGGDVRQITDGGSYFEPVFSPDGSRIAFGGHEDPEEAFAPPRIYTVTRAGTELRDELGDWDGNLGNEISGDVALASETIYLTWTPEGLFFLGTERGEANVYRVDNGAALATQGKHTVTDFSVADDGTFAYSCSDSTHPAEVFVQSNGQETPITKENAAFLEEVVIATPERFTFTGAHGEQSDGWLLAPPGSQSGKHPLLVYIHGGPHTAHGEVFFFEYQFLAGQGFGIFYPNIHGSSSYGREYQISIWRNWGTVDFEDVVAGTKEASSRPWVDQQRVGIVGGSYGGFMTIWALGHSDLYRAGITERCLCNWISFMGTSDGGWIWNRVTGAYPEQDLQKLWDMSPIKYASDIKVPLMVMHSEGDDRTPLEQGEQMFNTLRRMGKETKFIRFPEESHGLSRIGKPSRRVERLGYIRDWFKNHL